MEIKFISWNSGISTRYCMLVNGLEIKLDEKHDDGYRQISIDGAKMNAQHILLRDYQIGMSISNMAFNRI